MHRFYGAEVVLIITPLLVQGGLGLFTVPGGALELSAITMWIASPAGALRGDLVWLTSQLVSETAWVSELERGRLRALTGPSPPSLTVYTPLPMRRLYMVPSVGATEKLVAAK